MNAVILAAGIGERCAPLTYDMPKGLIPVFGVPAIERLIQQLNESGITSITVVTGYMKEKFDYLAKKYQVELVYNPEYNTKNNLASLYHVRDLLDSTYICVSDNYLSKNIFSDHEEMSWFSGPFYESKTTEWVVSEYTDKYAISRISVGGTAAYAIQGPAYFNSEFSFKFRKLLIEYYSKPESINYYWEHILLYEINRLPPMYTKDTTGIFQEFESYEELRIIDNAYYSYMFCEPLNSITNELKVMQNEIYGIVPVKEGMSNRSFRFSVGDRSYIYRHSGLDMHMFVNRYNEYSVLNALKYCNVTDKTVYFNPENGTKISEFLVNAHKINPYDDNDLQKALAQIRQIHELKIHVNTTDSIVRTIEKYQSIPNYIEEDLEIYEKSKEIFRLYNIICYNDFLIHGDYQQENILVLEDDTIRIIDWEYCGNGDPFLDVAFLALFAGFDYGRSILALECYLGHKPLESEHDRFNVCLAIRALFEASWAIAKISLGYSFKNYKDKMLNAFLVYYNNLNDLKEELRDYERI